MNKKTNSTILIGGTSHIGKSTLGNAVASRLNWPCLSTDSLARHPGRPWKTLPETVPDDVQEHYLSLSVEELFADVIRHYETVWPLVIDKISALPAGQGQVIEGSALWPDFVVSPLRSDISTVWLTANEELLQSRIYRESAFAHAGRGQQELITKFLQRTVYFNQRMVERVVQLGLPLISIGGSDTVEDLCEKIVQEHLRS